MKQFNQNTAIVMELAESVVLYILTVYCNQLWNHIQNIRFWLIPILETFYFVHILFAVINFKHFLGRVNRI